MTAIVLTTLGIALPALAICLAVRRWFEPVSWRICLLLLALIFIFTARGVFTTDVPVPLDEVVRGYPYRGLFGPVTSKNFLTNDTVKQILPWMQTVRDQLAAGRAPLWNPYLFCGYPLLGNGQSAPFSPFFLATLFVPLPKQIVAMAGLKLFVALLFGFLVVRREGVSENAALFGSAVFAFAIFNNAFLYYPMTAVTLLLPAAAYATLLTLRRATAAPVVLLALVVGGALAGGHPESVVHIVMAVIALVAIEWVAPPVTEGRFAFRDLVRVVTASVIGVAIGAPAWVPVLEQARISLRVLQLKSAAAGVPFPAKTLWAMVNPDGYGNPAHGNWNWMLSYTHVASVYLGLITTALLPAALLSPQSKLRDRLLVISAIVFFLVSLQWTFLTRLLYAAPPLSLVAHDRLRFVVCFFAGLVAARMVSRLRGADVALGLATSAVLIALSLQVLQKMWGRTLNGWSTAGIVCLVIFWVGSFGFRRLAPLLAFALTTIEMFVFTFDYNALTPLRYYAPRLPIIEALRSFAAAAPPEPFRVLGLDWVLLPNAAAQYRLQDVRGSDPMEWSDYARFFRVAEAKDASIDVKRVVDPGHVVTDFLNVRYLLTEPNANLGGKWQRIYAGRDGELYENTRFMSRFFVPLLARRVSAQEWERELATSTDFQETPIVYGKGLPPVIANPPDATITCRVHGPSEYRLRIVTSAPALVASSQPAMPSWQVFVNKRSAPMVRVNGAFIGFWVPSGSTDVRVVYRPLPFRIAVGAALLALLLLASYAVCLRRRSVRATERVRSEEGEQRGQAIPTQR